MKEIIDIATFERSSSFYPELDLILTVKSFDLSGIRKRYLNSRKKNSGRAGSVERREPGKGGLVELKIAAGRIRDLEVISRLTEPRGIDMSGGALAIAAENKIYHLSREGKTSVLEDPWFSYIHTVRFNPHDPAYLLISSSGLDLIKEYDINSGRCSYEWLAWEHGYARSRDPESGETIWLTRSPTEAERRRSRGEQVRLLENPQNEHLPTAMRAAFINSADYSDKPGKIIATFFHEGKVVEIDRESGRTRDLLNDLKNPHGGHVYNAQLRATSTGSGEIVLKGEREQRISLASLKGKPRELGDLEWIQNSISHENLIIAIDSNRTSFVIIDPASARYDLIPYDDNWAVQDLVIGRASEAQHHKLNALSEPPD